MSDNRFDCEHGPERDPGCPICEIERLRQEIERLTQENAELRDARKFVRKTIDRIQRGEP